MVHVDNGRRLRRSVRRIDILQHHPSRDRGLIISSKIVAETALTVPVFMQNVGGGGRVHVARRVIDFKIGDILRGLTIHHVTRIGRLETSIHHTGTIRSENRGTRAIQSRKAHKHGARWACRRSASWSRDDRTGDTNYQHQRQEYQHRAERKSDLRIHL